MEQRPLSKLAVASLILSTVSFSSIAIIILQFCSIIEIQDYIKSHKISIILFLFVILLAFAAIPALIISIVAMIKIKRNNLRGKVPTIISIMFIVVSAIILVSYFYYAAFILPDKRAAGHLFNGIHSRMTLLAGTESYWRSKDPDGNGLNDYWTYDISCMHRIYRNDNSTKVAFISSDLAKADAFPAPLAGGTLPFGHPQIDPWTDITTTAYSLYYFQAMKEDENGIPYNQNPVGSNKIMAANSNKFAFVAYPKEYSEFVYYTFIINEQGKVYFCDTGSDGTKIVLRWPSPEEFKGKKPKWRCAD